jgi:hypothetical protein
MTMKEAHVILGIHITDRLSEAVEVQKHLTAHGKFIKTRLGLHEVGDEAAGVNGVLILEMVGGEAKADALAGELNAIEGVEAKKLTFEHPA